MGDISIPKGATAKLGRVEGDLRVGQGARAESEGAIIEVTGRVICEGEAEFQGNLSCSEFSARGAWGSGGKIKILGDLKASGEVRLRTDNYPSTAHSTRPQSISTRPSGSAEMPEQTTSMLEVS